MDKIVLLKAFFGIASMVVCADKDATDEEILEFCNSVNPSGTSNGLCEIDREGARAPVPCNDDPNRLHIIVNC